MIKIGNFVLGKIPNIFREIIQMDEFKQDLEIMAKLNDIVGQLINKAVELKTALITSEAKCVELAQKLELAALTPAVSTDLAQEAQTARIEAEALKLKLQESEERFSAAMKDEELEDIAEADLIAKIQESGLLMPVTEESAPVTEESAPVIEESAPVIEESAPVIEESGNMP